MYNPPYRLSAGLTLNARTICTLCTLHRRSPAYPRTVCREPTGAGQLQARAGRLRVGDDRVADVDRTAARRGPRASADHLPSAGGLAGEAAAGGGLQWQGTGRTHAVDSVHEMRGRVWWSCEVW